MFANKIAALAGALAIMDQVAALNMHRAEHEQEKRDVAVVVETVHQTIYVTAGVPVATQNAVPEPAVNIVALPTQQAVAAAPPAAAAAAAAAPPASGSSSTGSNSGSNSGSKSGSGSNPFSGKRGLAYNNAALANVVGDSCKEGTCGWGYNWGQYAGNLDSKYSYVPMLWGKPFTSTWDATASKAVANGAKALMSFNEPDIASQANMSPAEAAKLQAQYLSPYSGKTLIGAPSVSNSNIAGQGLDWLKSFVQQCTGDCKFDYCNVHWYSPASAKDTLFTHLEQAHQICGGKPVWLTEFAPLNASPEEASAFLADVLPKLDKLDYLQAYSYFMVGSDASQLMSSATSLSTVGNKYASL